MIKTRASVISSYLMEMEKLLIEGKEDYAPEHLENLADMLLQAARGAMREYDEQTAD